MPSDQRAPYLASLYVMIFYIFVIIFVVTFYVIGMSVTGKLNMSY